MQHLRGLSCHGRPGPDGARGHRGLLGASDRRCRKYL